jgi:hypothetical protein
MAILSDTIVNENLKLLQINIWLEKWISFLIFLLGHIVLVTEFMARPTILYTSLSTKLRSKLQHQTSSKSAPHFSKCNMWTCG